MSEKFDAFNIGDVARAVALECQLRKIGENELGTALFVEATASFSQTATGEIVQNPDGFTPEQLFAYDGEPGLSDREAAILYSRYGAIGLISPEFFPDLDLMTEDRQIRPVDQDLVARLQTHYGIGEYEAYGLAVFHDQDADAVMGYVAETDISTVRETVIASEREVIKTELHFAGEQYDDDRVNEILDERMPEIDRKLEALGIALGPVDDAIRTECGPLMTAPKLK